MSAFLATPRPHRTPLSNNFGLRARELDLILLGAGLTVLMVSLSAKRPDSFRVMTHNLDCPRRARPG